MAYQIRPAQRSEAKPLIGLYSESGCGKTWSALTTDEILRALEDIVNEATARSTAGGAGPEWRAIQTLAETQMVLAKALDAAVSLVKAQGRD